MTIEAIILALFQCTSSLTIPANWVCEGQATCYSQDMSGKPRFRMQH